MSVAIMQLVEQGKLSLEDTAANYYPPLAKLRVIKDSSTGINGPTVALKKPINIKQLLTHTAGLSHGLEDNLFDQLGLIQVLNLEKPYFHILPFA